MGVIAIVVPLYLYEKALKSIDYLEDRMFKIEERVKHLEDRDEQLKTEIEKDIHEHVQKLVDQIHLLENKINQ